MRDWVQRWKDDDTFTKSIAQRPADNSWAFYDGPPFDGNAAPRTLVGQHSERYDGTISHDERSASWSVGVGLSRTASRGLRRKPGISNVKLHTLAFHYVKECRSAMVRPRYPSGKIRD